MAFGDLGDPATITAIVVVIIVACGIVLYAMRMRTRKPKKAPATSRD